MNVLSLFDGCSGGQQALERAGIKVDKYFASEIDKYAIKVTMANYPDTIQLGSVVDVDVNKLPPIQMLLGGSPCQSFSFAGKRKGMSTKDSQEILTLEHYLQLKSEGFEFEGQSYLFWEYMRILNDIRKYNPEVKFLLENVMMGEKWEKVLSKAIGVNPIEINSSLVSAQNRRRLYWTNIGMKPSGLFGDLVSIIEQPKDRGILLKDILESEVDEKYYLSDKVIERFKHYQSPKNNIIGTTAPDFRTIGQRDEVYSSNGKMGTLTATDYKQPKQIFITDEQWGAIKFGRTENAIIVHNLMPRSSTSGKGGTGHLSRQDGKTYCLDTGNTNAVEIWDDYNSKFREDGRIGAMTQNVSRDSLRNGFKILTNTRIRRLTPIECERLQTVKDGYTAYVSDSQRYKILGNGWTIDVIAYILSYLNK